RRDYVYDSDNELLTETWIASDGFTVLDVLSFTYDADGRRLTAANNAGTVTLAYDADGELTGEVGPTGLTLNFSYDADNNRTLVTDSLGGSAFSVYDADNHLVSRQFSGSGLNPFRIDFSYDADGQLVGATRYSDLTGTVQFGSSAFVNDSDGRLTH